MKAVKDLVPEIRKRREEIEAGRRLPADLAGALQKAGIFSMPVPRDLGGQQAPQTDIMRVIETLASADGSTGWCAMIGMGLPAGFMDERGAKEVFADPTAPTAGIAAPIGRAVRVDGGVRISGRWPFASGITHSNWVWAGCMIFDGDAPVMTPHGPEIIHAFIPRDELEVHDTWFVSGMCGTGSMDFSCTDVLVPEQRVWSLFDPTGHRPEPLYQLPKVAGFASWVASVSLGIARAALDELAEIAQTKVPSMSQAVLADRPVAHLEIARAEAQLGGARSFLYDTIDDLWQTLSAGREVTPRQNALARAACIHAVETSAAVTRTVTQLGGSSSLYNSSSLQRHGRDAEAIAHHFVVSPHVWEDAGRVLLGRPPLAPIF